MEAGRATHLIKVFAHGGEPLNELADSLAAAAAEADPARSVALDQDLDAVYFLLEETWVKWDALVRGGLVQRVAEQWSLGFSTRSAGGRVLRPCFPRFLSLHPGCCCRTRAGAHWARCWGR